jgi:dipeptidase E
MPVSSKRPKRLVLYSGGQDRRNALIHDALLELALRRRVSGASVRISYLPFAMEGSSVYFKRFERRYRAFGGTHFSCVAADDPALLGETGALQRAKKTLLSSDVIYLAGGNTFYFLSYLKRSSLFSTLRQFAQRGGVLAGLSAGALILTPTIELAGYPEWDRDENEIGLKRHDWKGLDLVPFEFFPHYRRSTRYREALRAYSSDSGRTLYACPDGSGLVIEGNRFTAHGDVWQFREGHATRLGR